MTEKVPGQKWRYVAFDISSDTILDRSDFLEALVKKSLGTPMWNNFRITVFEGNFGILKVSHRLKDDAILVLESVDSARGKPCTVKTLKTSGTIKTLKTKYKTRLADGRRRGR